MVESPQRIWIEVDDECPYFYEAHELHDVEQDVIEYVRADLVASLSAENDRLRKALERLLASPALADENHSDPEWGCEETAIAVTVARRALTGGNDA